MNVLMGENIRKIHLYFQWYVLTNKKYSADCISRIIALRLTKVLQCGWVLLVWLIQGIPKFGLYKNVLDENNGRF